MKVRNRLTFQFSLIVASILLIFSIAIYYFSSLYRAQEFDKKLLEEGLTTAKLLITVDEVDIKLLRIIDKNSFRTLEEEQVTVYNELNKQIYNKSDAAPIPLPKKLLNEIVLNKQVFYDDGRHEYAGLLYEDRRNRFVIMVSGYDKFGIDKLKNLRTILLMGFFISILVIYGTGWIFSGRALAPISDIVRRVKQITASNLNVRLDVGNGQDEIAQLSITFNEMLQRLEQAFEAQKAFVSNASHELRTPLTSIKAQLQVSLFSEKKEVNYKNILESLLEDTQRLIDLTNGLLDLTEMASESTSNAFKKIRLDELVLMAAGSISKKYSSVKINFEFGENIEEENDVTVWANELLIKTALSNIIDNAAKYSNSYPVVIKLTFDSNNVFINIIDSGVGIDNDDLNHIFAPFFRGKNVRGFSGHGIGLSLAHKIINLHKGKIYLTSEVSKRTTVAITFPKENLGLSQFLI